MLHMFRAGSGNQAKQCDPSAFLARYLLMMKISRISFYFVVLAAVGAKVLAQVAHEQARANGTEGPKMQPQAVEPQKTSGQKDIRAKRGTDLRLALVPQNANASLKTQGGLANVSDISTPESLPEHHLNVKERQEMRELLRQQRLKQQQN
jgi:hypothetical protein